MTTEDFKRKLSAILSADVKGYSRLMGDDEVATVKTITAYREVISGLVQRFRGRVVDSPGDNLLAEFDSAVDALKACFPAGTVSGAPKIRAMEIIAELEPDRRGAYAGAAGYLSFSGNMDMAIAIRTMITKNNTAYVQAGCGVVYDSDPEAEYQETVHKSNAIRRAAADAARFTGNGNG